jgi:hypothetical protein
MGMRCRCPVLAALALFPTISGPAWSREGAQTRQESPEALYASIKQASGASASLIEGLPSPIDDLIVLASCQTPEDAFGMDTDDPLYWPTTIAMRVQELTHSLRALGVPASLWQPRLDAMESLAIAHIRTIRNAPASAARQADATWRRYSSEEEALGEALDRYSRSSQVRGTIVVQEGCGAGEIEVELTTSPRGATVSYIPLFRYKLCQLRGIQPTSLQACDGWVSAVGGTERMSGKYMFVARWPDGRMREGILDVSSAPEDGSGRRRLIISR